MNAPLSPATLRLFRARLAAPVGVGGTLVTGPTDIRPEYADPFSVSIGVVAAITGELGALDAPDTMPAGSTEAAWSPYGDLPFACRQTISIRPRAYL
ncbi:hypothetical protein [Denitromonas halophila]|uniref:Uncharacterized protein n=1 Tax=Denitromonas halophila TaxID=1629404 RepID=A0A557QLP7_9RHOO|nr:hypothetical protein [Denitromonas halophila]TVO53827.1 hypothetical protein FHP91_13600 [Denitromonas halophila]